MAIAAIAIVLICIGSVSASDEIQDGNLTAIDNSQDQSIDIEELNEESYSDDIVASDEDTVSLANEKEDTLNAYDSNGQYCDELTTLTISSEDNTASVNNVELGSTVTVHAEWRSTDKNFQQGTPAESNRNIDLMKNGVLLTSKTGTFTSIDYYQGTAYFAADFEITFDGEGWWNITAHKDRTQNAYGQWLYGAADSNLISFYVPSSSAPGKEDVTLYVTVDDESEEDNVYYSEYDDEIYIVTSSETQLSGNIIYKEGEIELGRAEAGEEFILSDLTVGDHEITAVWEGDEEYNPASVTFTVSVTKKQIYFDIQIDDVQYPDHAVAVFESNVYGNYTITINGTDYKINYLEDEEEDSLYFDIEQLPVGTYKVENVIFNDDSENYEIDFDDEDWNDLPSFEVMDKIPTGITVNIDEENIKVGESIVISVNVWELIDEGAAINQGNVLIYDDNNPEIAIINLSETDSYTFTPSYPANEDEYVIYAKYLGNEKYGESDPDYEYYMIEADDSKIAELTIRDANYPDNATIEISGKGNVTITIEYYLESSVDEAIMPQIKFNGDIIQKTVDDPVKGTYTAVTFVVNETCEFTVSASYSVYSFSTGAVTVDAEDTLTYSVTILPPAKDITLNVEVDGEYDENDYYSLEWGAPAFEVVTTASEDIDAEIIYKEGDNELGRAKVGKVFEIDPKDLGLGDHIITATLEGSEDYNEANYTFTLNVDKKIIWYKLQIDNVTYPDHAVGKFYSDVDGKYTITINGEEYEVDFAWTDVDEPVSFDIKQLPAGTYTPSSISFEDLEHYVFGESEREGQNKLPTFAVKEDVVLDESVLTVSNGTSPVFSIDLPGATGNLTVTVGDKNYTKELVDGKATVVIDDLAPSNYVATVTYTGDETHKAASVPASFEVEGQNIPKEDVELNDTVLSVVNGTAPSFSIDLPGATGNLTVTVDGKNYTKELVDGKATVEITDLPAGNYTATVTYTGDESHKASSVPASFKVEDKETPDVEKALDVNVPEGSTNPVFSINLPGATGNLTVTVDGKNYTKELVNGSATIVIDDLAPGNHNVTVRYSGDGKHSPISKDTTVSIPTPVLASNRNINVVYSGNAVYSVRVTANGKAVAGEKVTIKFNGRNYQVTTNANGYATLKINTKIKPKKYTITAEFKGVKVSNTVTVKHLFKVKNLKAKKSKKVLKIKIKTYKVNGKFLKGKKLKLKLKGKVLKAKINKKGVATFKVKKNILKKLKVGKKYKYTVSYGKDKLTKKITVRR